MKGGGALDWSAFVPLAVHPTKVGIAEALRWIDRPLSASELKKIFCGKQSAGSIGHHLRQMVKWGALESAGERIGIRGAPTQLYDFTDLVTRGMSASVPRR
jgi:hypothetical protein